MDRVKIFKNISWLFIDKIIRIFGSLVVGIWVARYLGPNDYGKLNYAISYTFLFTVFVSLGLDKILIREIVKRPQDFSSLLGTAFWLKVFGAVVAIGCILLSLNFVEKENIIKKLILIISCGFIFQAFDVIDYYFQAKVISKYIVIARSCSFFVISLFKIFLILNKSELLFFGLSSTLEILMSAIFMLIVFSKLNGKIIWFNFDKSIAVSLLKNSWPIAISSFLISVQTRIDQVMIGNILNTREVGIYSAAVKLTHSWMFIPNIVVISLLPYFVGLRETDSKLYKNRLKQIYSIMFWMGVFVGIFIIFYGQKVIILLFGDEYKGAYGALIFNIWNGIFMSQALAGSIWMISENLQKYTLYNNFIIVILNISLNITLIPKFGISGAALATLATQVVGTWGVSFLWKPLREIAKDMITAVNPIYLLKFFKVLK